MMCRRTFEGGVAEEIYRKATKSPKITGSGDHNANFYRPAKELPTSQKITDSFSNRWGMRHPILCTSTRPCL